MDQDERRPTHSSWEHNMTDVNQPVTIEPPEQACVQVLGHSGQVHVRIRGSSTLTSRALPGRILIQHYR